MPQIASKRLRAAAACGLLLALAGLLLTACGGSSKGSTSTSAAKTTASNGRGSFGARGAALRTCLQKNGITLPQRKPGRRANPGAGGPFGAGGSGAGAAKLPNGVTRAQLQAALKKCGGGQFGRGGKGFAAGGSQRFAKFAACMRKNGVDLPQPNTSGKGPIFDTQGINTKSASFKAADAKCVRELAPAGGAPGAPGTGAQAPSGAAPGEAPGSAGAATPPPGE